LQYQIPIQLQLAFSLKDQSSAHVNKRIQVHW